MASKYSSASAGFTFIVALCFKIWLIFCWWEHSSHNECLLPVQIYSPTNSCGFCPCCQFYKWAWHQYCAHQDQLFGNLFLCKNNTICITIVSPYLNSNNKESTSNSYTALNCLAQCNPLLLHVLPITSETRCWLVLKRRLVCPCWTMTCWITIWKLCPCTIWKMIHSRYTKIYNVLYKYRTIPSSMWHDQKSKWNHKIVALPWFCLTPNW